MLYKFRVERKYVYYAHAKKCAQIIYQFIQDIYAYMI